MLNLDTHILIHALAGELTPRERDLLGRQPWSISSIVLWELTKLKQLHRVEISLEDPEVIRIVSRIHTWPIDLNVCREIVRLDITGDPADEIIAATSIAFKVPLLTRDRKIRKSKRVPLAS